MSGKHVAELLRKAANEHLWDGAGELPPGVDALSCFAVILAEGADTGLYVATLAFLSRLGVNAWDREFAEFEIGAERQGARFLWLHFAALVAEDGGI